MTLSLGLADAEGAGPAAWLPAAWRAAVLVAPTASGLPTPAYAKVPCSIGTDSAAMSWPGWGWLCGMNANAAAPAASVAAITAAGAAALAARRDWAGLPAVVAWRAA